MAPAPADERKLVTVLFADLAGSTELAARHDAEDLRSLLAAFFEEMAQHIQAFGGTVEKYAGDAIMAVFGVPVMHEDDAERAVRAAMAMQAGLAQLNPMFEQEYGAALALRIGIATGEAVAAAAPTKEFLVTGEVANLAARLQAAATGVVVSEETHRLLQALLVAEALPPLALKGFAAPARAFAVSGLRAVEGRPRGGLGLSSPVVGRERQLEALGRCAEEVARGRGQIVLIVGEAGLGKSRLKNELREHPPTGVRWLEGRCYAYTQGTSYAPLVQVLRPVLGLSGGEPPALARTRLRAGLRNLLAERGDQHRAVLGQLLGVEPEPGALPIDPRALQSQLVLALRAIAEALLQRGPVILAIEDLHWADPASIEGLTLLTELTDFLPLMMLITSRPEMEPAAWDLRFHVQRNFPHRLTELVLQPLDAAQSERLLVNLLHVESLPEALRQRVRDLAEGNPFFVEEILRSLIEEGTLRRDGERWTAAADVERLTLPTTLRGVIGARIDRLAPPVKAALQRASVIGRFFEHEALRALSDAPADLDRSVAQLLRAELIREWARLPERQYIFKHALTQETAYAGILVAERRGMHRRLAEHLEQTAAGAGGDQADVLAGHWLRAEEPAKALHWTLLAADRARKLYARPAAIAHYWQALALLDQLPRTPERMRLHADAVLALVELPGWRRSEPERLAGPAQLAKAIAAAAEIGDEPLRTRLDAQHAWLELDEPRMVRAIASAEATGDASLRAFTHLQHGGYLGQVGRYEASLDRIARGIELLEQAKEIHEQGYEMASSGRCYSARAGRLGDAFRYAARARELAQTLQDPRLKAWRAMESEPFMYKGLWEDVVRVADEALPDCWEIREWGPIFWASSWAAIGCVRLGRLDRAGELIARALPECEAQGGGPFQLVWLLIARAELALASGEGAAALAAAERAAEVAERSHLRLEQGAALRVLGQVHAAGSDRAAADRAFGRSLTVLEEIQSRPELGQTLLAYGRFLVPEDAPRGHALIGRALGLFEDMDATGWIGEARAVLASHPGVGPGGPERVARAGA